MIPVTTTPAPLSFFKEISKLDDQLIEKLHLPPDDIEGWRAVIDRKRELVTKRMEMNERLGRLWAGTTCTSIVSSLSFLASGTAATIAVSSLAVPLLTLSAGAFLFSIGAGIKSYEHVEAAQENEDAIVNLAMCKVLVSQDKFADAANRFFQGFSEKWHQNTTASLAEMTSLAWSAYRKIEDIKHIEKTFELEVSLIKERLEKRYMRMNFASSV